MRTEVLQINMSPDELRDTIKAIIIPELEKINSKLVPSKEKEFLTREETISLLGITYVCLREWEKKGLIIPYKLGGRNYYMYQEIISQISSSVK